MLHQYLFSLNKIYCGCCWTPPTTTPGPPWCPSTHTCNTQTYYTVAHFFGLSQQADLTSSGRVLHTTHYSTKTTVRSFNSSLWNLLNMLSCCFSHYILSRCWHMFLYCALSYYLWNPFWTTFIIYTFYYAHHDSWFINFGIYTYLAFINILMFIGFSLYLKLYDPSFMPISHPWKSSPNSQCKFSELNGIKYLLLFFDRPAYRWWPGVRIGV